MIWLYALVSVILVSLISFIGVSILALNIKVLNKTVFYLVSFSAGALLGNAFLHLLPEALTNTTIPLIMILVLTGILTSFIIEKAIRRHSHIHQCDPKHPHCRPQPYAYLNLIGDAIHNFVDGLIIAASYIISIPLGIATTIAVILHEIPQELGDFGVLVYGGFKKTRALLYNFLSGITAIAGAITVILLSNATNVANYLIPFAAGNFIYIACTNLLPELHKTIKVKDSIIQVMLMTIGIIVMFALILLE